MNYIKRYWRIIFPIFFAILIWVFSSHSGAASDAESSAVASFWGLSNEAARKIAHFVLFIKGLHPVSFPRYTQVVYPVIFTIVYGALDEVHQLTVAGRNGSADDVLVDTLAGVGGVLLYIAIFCFFRLWKKRSGLLK